MTEEEILKGMIKEKVYALLLSVVPRKMYVEELNNLVSDICGRIEVNTTGNTEIDDRK